MLVMSQDFSLPLIFSRTATEERGEARTVATEEGEKLTEATREASEELGTRASRTAPGAAEASEAPPEATVDVEVALVEATRGATEAVATRGGAVTNGGAAMSLPRRTGANRWPGTRGSSRSCSAATRPRASTSRPTTTSPWRQQAPTCPQLSRISRG